MSMGWYLAGSYRVAYATMLKVENAMVMTMMMMMLICTGV